MVATTTISHTRTQHVCQTEIDGIILQANGPCRSCHGGQSGLPTKKLDESLYSTNQPHYASTEVIMEYKKWESRRYSTHTGRRASLNACPSPNATTHAIMQTSYALAAAVYPSVGYILSESSSYCRCTRGPSGPESLPRLGPPH